MFYRPFADQNHSCRATRCVELVHVRLNRSTPLPLYAWASAVSGRNAFSCLAPRYRLSACIPLRSDCRIASMVTPQTSPCLFQRYVLPVLHPDHGRLLICLIWLCRFPGMDSSSPLRPAAGYGKIEKRKARDARLPSKDQLNALQHRPSLFAVVAAVFVP